MISSHRFDPTVLREYDIRGTVDKNLSRADAYAVGRAFGAMVARRGGTRVAVGYDGRVSSPGFATAVSEGLSAGGLHVIQVGMGPTPMLYYSVHELDAGGGIMITGSHNPPDQNGFKMMLGPKLAGGGAFFGKDIQELGRIAAAGEFTTGKGAVARQPMLDKYVDRLAQEYGAGGGKTLNAVWDAGNGAAGEAMVRITRRLPGNHILLFEKIDGTFPNHHPDPTVAKNLVDLQAAVRASKSDFGVAFDGDGDRIGVVDGEGEILWADQLMVLFARELLSRRPGETIIADVKASQVLFDEVAKAGGKPLMYKTGHSLIKAKMKETKAPFAGEMSGHLFFADGYYGFDDGLYAAVRLLRILSHSKDSLADLRKGLPPAVNTPEMRFECDEARKWAVIDEVRARLKNAGADLNDLDGVRVKTSDGWWLLRASNTQAVLVARCEGSDTPALARLKAALAAQLKASGVALPADLF
ncbi:MAG: phosphoglucomutase/phosphomannomutase PgmG [Alphaproteobacteria bacterium]